GPPTTSRCPTQWTSSPDSSRSTSERKTPRRASRPSSSAGRPAGGIARMALVQDRVVVTAALTGVLATREQCPYLPYTPAEIGEEARRAYEAGAAVVHIHGRAPDGGPTWSADTYAEIKREVEARSPIIVNFSTGGFNMGADGDAEKSERLSYVWKTQP